MQKILFLMILGVILISGCTSDNSENTIKFSNYSEELQGGHMEVNDADPCTGIVCEDTTMDCGSGDLISCSNICEDGKCTKCIPECEYVELEDEEFLCEVSERKCPDGHVDICENRKVNGKCTKCTPSCSGHMEPTGLCKDVICKPSSKECSNGYDVICENTCDPDTGKCTKCTPDCGDTDCETDWTCTSWSDCDGGVQTRECADDNNCDTNRDKPDEEKDCEGDIIDHLVFSEVLFNPDGDEPHGEWVEIYNPTSTDMILDGWSIEDNQYAFLIPDNTFLESKRHMIIARNTTYFYNEHGCQPTIDETPTFTLSNTADSLTLYHDSEVIDYVEWGPLAWEIEAGNGESIKRKPNIEDTDTEDDWLSNQTPQPACA